MKTPCCIENENKCENDLSHDLSRSMVLRSGCAYGRSYSSFASDEVHKQHSDEKRSIKKYTENALTNAADSESLYPLESLLETSYKQITLKSAKNLSFLKETLYKSLDFSENRKIVHNRRKVNNTADHHIIKTSTPISSSFAQNKVITSEDFFGYDHSSERIKANMSGRNLERRHLRALSDSEGEEGDSSSIEGRSRSLRATRSSSAIYRNSQATVSSSTSSSHHLSSNNHGYAVASLALSAKLSSANHNESGDYRNNVNISRSSLNTSQLNRSLVQESSFSKILHAFWSFIYLKIISWISFDVWLLSRLRGNKKVLVLLFLPLLTYLAYCAFIWSNWNHYSSLITYLNSFTTSNSEKMCNSGPLIDRVLGVLNTSFTSFYSSLSAIFSYTYWQTAKIEKREEKTSYSSHLQEELADLRQKLKLLQQFQSDQQRSCSKDIELLSAEYEVISKKLKVLEEELFSQKLNTKDFIASFEKQIVAALLSVTNGDKTSPYHFFSMWLNSKSDEIKSVIEHLRKELRDKDTNSHKVIESLVRHYIESMKVSKSFETDIWDSKSDKDVQKIVRDAIRLYDSDKTGLADYALESAGGTVISIRCSESYAEKRGTYFLYGLPLYSWADQNSPRTAIQPDVHPGQCWSFKGSQGYLVIQLSYSIKPTGFTLENIPASLSPTGSIDSAPREFSVWALSSEKDVEGTLLGKYSYDDKGEPLQYFSAKNNVQLPISFVELKIHSNHGNLEYTCLYRFRVHGTLV